MLKIATGSGVKIAVIDMGVDLTHPDLINNLLPGYDATDAYYGGSDGGYGGNGCIIEDAHGTACAGIIAAEDNEIGIKGVAYNAKIIPIRIGYQASFLAGSYCFEFTHSSDVWIIDGIHKAWHDFNADILSNSWCVEPPLNAIDDEILAALTFGRNSLGSVVIFASGNTNYNFIGLMEDIVSYPACLQDVIAVGGISPCGERKSRYSCDYEGWGSLYGTQLDVVAPGVLIATTDLQGGEGYNPKLFQFEEMCDTIPCDFLNQDYTMWFSGTSAATPHVAGVAALVLSVNPTLTSYQVRDIIESTAQKVRPDLYDYQTTPGRTNGTWHEEMGYGLVDAYTAVNAALCIGNFSPEQMDIFQSTIWSGSKFLIGEYLIKNGATLTITSEIKCSPNTKFIVEPGGSLIIDGGKLTNACESKMWQGIVVLGDPQQDQTPYTQGTVELRNGAIIENAICGISVADYNGLNSTGGLVFASNAIFKNNLSSVEYFPYYNTEDNQGGFWGCLFTVDGNNLFEENGVIFDSHVKLWGVNGVTFSGCSFINVNETGGKGIYAQDAGFNIYAICKKATTEPCRPCPSLYATPCIFENLKYGIFTNNTGNPYYLSIDRTEFNNNKTSVYINSSNNYSLTDNRFSDIINFGLISKSSSGYNIVRNKFDGTCPSNKNTGILTSNSGVAENIINNNSFENLKFGLMTKFINGVDTLPHYSTGLQFLCNNFTDNYIDIFVDSNATVRSYQGNINKGADNYFNNTHLSSLVLLSNQPSVYFHSPGNNHAPFSPVINSFSSINNTALPNSCISNPCLTLHVNNTGIEGQEQYINLQNEYDNFVEEFVNNGYDYILSNQSSGEFPEETVFEAMRFLSRIYKTGNTMRELSDNAIRAIMKDSIMDINLLKTWYQLVRTPIAKYLLAETHFFTNDFELADAVLYSIPDMFTFSDSDYAEHNNYIRFHNFKKRMILSERTWTELQEGEISELQTIAEANTGRSSTMAKGVLCFFYDICYEEEIDEIIEDKTPDFGTPVYSLNTINKQKNK